MRSFSEDQVLKVTIQLASVRKMLKCQEKIKEKLRMRFRHIREGLALQKTHVVLHDIYTELYITEGGSDAVQSEHEVRLIEKAAKNFSKQETPVKLTDIFKSPSEPGDYIRMVLTKGIAGIGKTVSVQKFILDWAENEANQDIDLILPLFFRDLNHEKKDCSLMELLQAYFFELKDIESIENGIKVLLVLDGLDECRLSLDFDNTRNCSDIMEPASVEVLLTNLIRGNLLPRALLWITSRPAATNQIPSHCVQRVTKVRGFSDLQKEGYFHKKCTNSDLADTMIKHVKSSRSIDMMCHIPIFCWIMATVLDIMLKDTELGEIPKNQTQLYTHYLLIQTGLKNRKYQKAMHEDLRKLSESDRKMILNLAKLAFQELEKGNLIFYEDDLKECGIDINDASDFSSMCTQLFREEFGLYRERVFCFLHLSVQEHLAAVHVLCTYLNEGINVLESDSHTSTTEQTTLTRVLKSAVEKALESENGHFDQFLRFLLGLSFESNQKLLQGLLHHPQKQVQKKDEIVSFIKRKISEGDITETATINLFHCLNEINHDYLVKDIQDSLHSSTLFEKELKPEECSALAFVLLMSKDVMEVFDLKEYKTEPPNRQRLLPIIRASKKAILSSCELSEKACETVASALRIGNSPVRELDLSNNNIGDSGVGHICSGLKSPHCRLEILSLAGCKITAKSCESLASTLQGTESHLQELDLSFNKLTDSGMKVLEPWLRSEQCKVQRVGLRQCHLSKDYCRSLNEALSSSQKKQMDLDLRENDLKN
ncbi:NLR family CARD domain-containing protein 3-like [Colossoma macropomum]|uniref:NLR family CARD domain-containing protein 3-like n=1 Tax=Colossoma macropomum TaxID=42526 RepID=UPI001864FFE4|nr:NLR family CARD domain-containing protein 3-like [Colossoma macropomum]XP_036423251.1 NLR family CARD domain-containing protein 3-like [Colossoma macropomum]XP_036423252.1 NLR family CARD domain-containing protein 3-like [Colossoma macropomum]